MEAATICEVAGPEAFIRHLPLKYEGSQPSVLLPVQGARPVELHFTPLREAPNAYPLFMDLFDGGLDIFVFSTAKDNQPDRNDLFKAKKVFELLPELGLDRPVSSFDQLRLDSPPAVGQIHVDGQIVPVRLRLLHTDMAADAGLIDAAFRQGYQPAVPCVTPPAGRMKRPAA